MISIVTCNYDRERIKSLSENIDSTIGIKYELIIIDNSSNEFSIFQAYNKGVKLSKFEKILFMHDDVFIHTQDFGKILLNLDLPNLGVLGIAGSEIKTKIVSPWWISNHETVKEKINYQFNIQHFKNSEPKIINIGFEKENQVEEVILVDGVFLYTNKENCLKAPFDETYNSFHFYDLDFALNQFKNGKTNYVTNSILLEHFSAGSLNGDWINSSFYFGKKWKEFMKVNSIFINDKQYFERLAFDSRLRVLLDCRYFSAAFVLFCSNLFFFSLSNLKYFVRSLTHSYISILNTFKMKLNRLGN
jgi:hypothetical protein